MGYEPLNVKSIFLDAIENHPPERWPAFLEEACGGDPQLRRRAEELLQAHSELGSLPGTASFVNSDTVQDEMIAERPGQTVGRYKLLAEIGEGGFGVVYMAEQQEPVRRYVALKIVKPGMVTREVVARFQAERQALALMDHPNIAHVYDAGATDSGRPYFVMELVCGTPLTGYCDQHQLTIRQRLELFVQVCHAVQHAHQKGVIHRDLKPSNVTVIECDGAPVPKIIDFGIAKAISGQLIHEKMFATTSGQIIGTPLYMSPEQAAMGAVDVDTRSDVYSLGVMLYELLVGSTPIDRERGRKADLDEVRRMIREEDPPRPSARITALGDAATTVCQQRQTEPPKLSRLLRRELDWIVMKALEKDRARRYPTANALAADIHRYLADEPVQARPPTLADRTAKWARRHRTVVGSAVVLLIAAMAAGALGTALVWREKQRAESALRAVEREAARSRAVIELVQEMLASASPYGPEGKDYTVRQLLDKFSATIGGRLEGQPEVEATIRALLGKTYAQLFAYQQADRHLKAAIELYRQTLENQHEERLAECLLDYAWNLQTPEAGQAAREALAIYRKLGDPRGAMRALWILHICLISREKRYAEADQVFEEARALASEHSEVAGTDYACLIHGQGISKRLRGQLEEAEALGREAVALHRRVSGQDHPELAFGLWFLGTTLAARGDTTGAESCFREALAIFQTRYGRDANERTVGGVRADLENLLAARGDRAALEQLRKWYDGKPTGATDELARLDQAVERNPRDPQTFLSRAAWFWDKSEFEKALADYAKGLAVCQRLAIEFPGDPQRVAAAARNYRDHAWHLKGLGKTRQSELAFRELLALWTKLAERFPNQPEYRYQLAYIYCGLGGPLSDMGRADEAEQCNRQAVAILEKLVADAPDNAMYRSFLAENCYHVANHLRRRGRPDEAQRFYREAVTHWEKVGPESRDPPGPAWLHLSRGRSYFELGRPAEALAQCQQGIALAPDNVFVLRTTAWWMVRFPGSDRPMIDAAIRWAEKAAELDPRLPSCWTTLGAAHYRAGNWKEAIEALQKAGQLRGDNPCDLLLLAMAQWQLGQKDEARKSYQRAIEQSPFEKPDAESAEELRRFHAEAENLLGIEPSGKAESPKTEGPTRNPENAKENPTR